MTIQTEIDAFLVEDLVTLEALERKLQLCDIIPDDEWKEYLSLTKFITVTCTIEDGYAIPQHPLAVKIPVSICRQCPTNKTSLNFSRTPNTMLGLDQKQIFAMIQSLSPAKTP